MNELHTFEKPAWDSGLQGWQCAKCEMPAGNGLHQIPVEQQERDEQAAILMAAADIFSRAWGTDDLILKRSAEDEIRRMARHVKAGLLNLKEA